MSKKIGFVSVMVVVFVVVLMAFAGTALAAGYDFTTHTVDHSQVSAVSSTDKHNQAAAGENPCESCHVPHGATGAFLWDKTLTAVDSIGGNTDEDSANAAHYSSDIKPLCYSCHDGTVGSGGENATGTQTVFSADHYNHRTTAASYVGSSGLTGPGKDCDRCHNPHDDNAYASDGSILPAPATSKYLLPEYKTRTYDENGHVVKFSANPTVGGSWHVVPYADPTNLAAEYNWTSSTGSNPAPTGNKAPSTLSRWSTKISGGDFCASCHESNLPSQTASSKRFVHPVYQPAVGRLTWDSTTMGIANIDTANSLLIYNTLGRPILGTSPNPGANTIASSWMKTGLFDPSATGNPRNGTRVFNADGTLNATASTANGGTRVATAYVMCESCHSPHGALADGYTAPTAPSTTGVHHLNTMAESALCGNCH